MPTEGRGVPPLLAKVFNLVLFLAPSQRYQNANNSVLAGSELIWKWFYYCFQNLELLPPQFENPWETNTSFFLHVGRNKINSGIQNDENRINREIWNDGRARRWGEIGNPWSTGAWYVWCGNRIMSSRLRFCLSSRLVGNPPIVSTSRNFKPVISVDWAADIMFDVIFIRLKSDHCLALSVWHSVTAFVVTWLMWPWLERRELYLIILWGGLLCCDRMLQ